MFEFDPFVGDENLEQHWDFSPQPGVVETAMFTTPDHPFDGALDSAEYNGTTAKRRIWMSTDEKGLKIVPKSEEKGTHTHQSINVPGSSDNAQLEQATVYYIHHQILPGAVSPGQPTGTRVVLVLKPD